MNGFIEHGKYYGCCLNEIAYEICIIYGSKEFPSQVLNSLQSSLFCIQYLDEHKLMPYNIVECSKVQLPLVTIILNNEIREKGQE